MLLVGAGSRSRPKTWRLCNIEIKAQNLLTLLKKLNVLPDSPRSGFVDMQIFQVAATIVLVNLQRGITHPGDQLFTSEKKENLCNNYRNHCSVVEPVKKFRLRADIGVLWWQSSDNAYKILTIYTQIERKNRNTFKKAKLFTLFLKTGFFVVEIVKKNFWPEPAAWVEAGAGQYWTGSTTLGTRVQDSLTRLKWDGSVKS